MSADIAVFHSSEMDDATLLPDGFYIGAMRENAVEEATGPYDTETQAVMAMVARPLGAWIVRECDLPTGIHRYQFDGTAFLKGQS